MDERYLNERFSNIKVELASTDEEWVEFYHRRIMGDDSTSDRHAELLDLEISHIYDLSDYERRLALGKLLGNLVGAKIGKEFFGDKA